MARIRTIKPEFWTNEQVMDCSPTTRLLFIGLWNFCDDQGRHELSARKIKAEIFPGDDILSETILRMLDELSAAGLVSFYSVDGKEYLRVTGWHHQKIDKPQKPRCPPPPESGAECHSSNGRRMVATERRGEESRETREGKEYKLLAQLPTAARPERADQPAAERPPNPGAAPEPVKSELDRVEAACRQALGDVQPMDVVIGPMVETVREFGQERVSVALASEARRPRRRPIRTWRIWADVVRESLASSGASPPPQCAEKPASAEFLADRQRAQIRDWLAAGRRNACWSESSFGPSPAEPGCRIPEPVLAEFGLARVPYPQDDEAMA